MNPVDTSNEFYVGAAGIDIVILAPPLRCTKAAALRMAAWLVALAEDEPGQFNAVLEAVKNT